MAGEEKRRRRGENSHHHAKQNAAPSKERASVAARLSPLRGDATTRGAPVNEQHAKRVYALEDAYMHICTSHFSTLPSCAPPPLSQPPV